VGTEQFCGWLRPNQIFIHVKKERATRNYYTTKEREKNFAPSQRQCLNSTGLVHKFQSDASFRVHIIKTNYRSSRFINTWAITNRINKPEAIKNLLCSKSMLLGEIFCTSWAAWSVKLFPEIVELVGPSGLQNLNEFPWNVNQFYSSNCKFITFPESIKSQNFPKLWKLKMGINRKMQWNTSNKLSIINITSKKLIKELHGSKQV
jgi:hypothetical protein